jgi:hypothetical protein
MVLQLAISLAATPHACAAARAFTDVEVDLKIVSFTPGATVSFVGSGTGQLNPGPLPGAVTDDFNRLRIAGVVPADNVPVPMSVGHFLEFDAQAEVRTDTLAPGQATFIRIDHTGLMEFQNTGSTDATITFDIEREHRLRSFLDDPATEFARAHKTFSLSAFTFDASGVAVDSFPLLVNFDQEAQQGVQSTGPSDHFNFTLFVPAGGSGRITMASTGFSEVRLVPEPGAMLLAASGAASSLIGWRRRAKRGA